MVPAIFNYFGRTNSEPVKKNPTPVRALPASWYTSPEMYELERRAIYSRKWLLTTHKLRFTQAGDWLRYDIAGFQIIICRDREGNINAFHNVCRHRAFPLVTEEKGTAKIFACKYHGWSYGLSGKLAKAPGYQELDDFDKTKNNLFPVHVHVDHNGFIWLNLDSKETPEVAWSDDFLDVDTQERVSEYNFEEYHFDHAWEMEGAYNWKILADNYNECYHCPTAHPDIPAIADLEAYSVDTENAYIKHNAASSPEQCAAGLKVAPTFYFPNATMNVTPRFFFMQRFVPSGPTTSAMRYEVYRHNNVSDEDFEFINQMYKRIMSEDKYLCTLTQKNLNAGIFVNGEMHPRMEKGPLFFQGLVREVVTEHHAREKIAGREIWPARQNLPNATSADVSKEDEDFCSGLACQTNQQAVW